MAETILLITQEKVSIHNSFLILRYEWTMINSHVTSVAELRKMETDSTSVHKMAQELQRLMEELVFSRN